MPLQDLPDRRGCDGDAEPGQLAGDLPVPPMLVVGRHAQLQADDVAVGRWSPWPLRSGFGGPAAADDIAAPAQIVRGVMNECSAPWRERGMSVSSAANSARSVHVSLGRAGVCRCRTASWWRSRRISASFHACGRLDSRSHAGIWTARRNTKRRHTRRDHRRPGCLTASWQHPDDLPVRVFGNHKRGPKPYERQRARGEKSVNADHGHLDHLVT